MSELKLQQSRLDGRYDIVECLGRGSYAEIYVANDNAAQDGAPRTIVIKALNIFLQDEPDEELAHTLVTNFQNEAVALDRVRHPNVINRLGHGTAIDLVGTTFHYIVLEYLPGGDLSALTRNRPLPIDRAVHYLEQVCSGLAHAHKCGVIHRDIKPQNLLLTADRQTVKIADFGVARLDASEGAITRVGTNIYSAPEHNPLMQTGQLDTALLTAPRDLLTPAADIYSLAKTVYTLLAGESPRRFAQHTITELPQPLKEKAWATSMLRVLEKATKSRPEDRYQTVEEFWDEFADASLPPTRPLQAVTAEIEPRRKPSEDLSINPEEFTEAAPPRPHFATPDTAATTTPVETDTARRPRIVVPISLEVKRQMELEEKQEANYRKSNLSARKKPTGERSPSKPARRALVAAGLVLAFSGMLLATHKYVTSHWNPFTSITHLGDTFEIGKEGVTTTDVNLRPVANTANAPIGLAESGSRVKVLTIAENNWVEVQVMVHGRQKTDPYSSDRGWINRRYVKFE